METSEKTRIYQELYRKAEAFCEVESDLVAKMANLCVIMHEDLGHWWTGFYRVVDEQLVLGPFQGPVACTRIRMGKGVCGTAWKEQRTLVVPDVHQFPGHIACSSASNSEIVVPIWSRGTIVGEIDIDSTEFDAFDDTDAFWLERIAALMTADIDLGLKDYIKAEILPQYDGFDPAHRLDHVHSVIASSLVYAGHYDVSPQMCYAIAAYHDTGLAIGREVHHSESARIIREDSRLQQWFTAQEIETMAQAAQDHRASSKSEPRSIYGRIVAEADRQIDPFTIMLRTVQYGLGHYPKLDKEGNWQRTLEHLNEKYARGGYLKLWIPFGPNAAKLQEMQEIIENDPAMLRRMFEKAWEQALS